MAHDQVPNGQRLSLVRDLSGLLLAGLQGSLNATGGATAAGAASASIESKQPRTATSSCPAQIMKRMPKAPSEVDTETINLRGHVPPFLRHSENETPVPSWRQVTRSVDSPNPSMAATVSRIVAGVDDEQAAVDVWNGWPGSYRRSVALLVDKISHEGWLDSVGPIAGWPWDGGYYFWPRIANLGMLDDVLRAKTETDGVYTRCTLRNGLAAYLSGWNHKAWKRSWIENDSPFASLHVGIFANGSAEVHLDLFNPVYTNGASRSQVRKLPCLGSYNKELFRLHRQWEGAKYGAITRTSANLYHLMRGTVPLCF